MEKKNKKGVIYIFTNPSFPQYVKIGYANDVNERLDILNSSTALPFAFRVYATYEVEHELEDKKVHKIIDTINPELRSVENINGKIRKREFFQMSKEQAYTLLECIAEISGTKDKLHLIKATENDIREEQEANEIREMELNRHHFKDIEFYSSLTNKYYYTKTSSQGTLSIFEKETNAEVPNNSNPSKKQIVLQALRDLEEDVNEGLTLYQLEHRLEKKICNR
ncbi:MAG: GIY-YIG nuclease family protein [Clostridium sp.]|nr:GIY-YIG nuclease family protein [Clostridium sp.]